MTKDVTALDELLSDPMIQLVMARDRVRPEELRLLLLERVRSAEPSLPPHVIAETCRLRRLCA